VIISCRVSCESSRAPGHTGGCTTRDQAEQDSAAAVWHLPGHMMLRRTRPLQDEPHCRRDRSAGASTCRTSPTAGGTGQQVPAPAGRAPLQAGQVSRCQHLQDEPHCRRDRSAGASTCRTSPTAGGTGQQVPAPAGRAPLTLVSQSAAGFVLTTAKLPLIIYVCHAQLGCLGHAAAAILKTGPTPCWLCEHRLPSHTIFCSATRLCLIVCRTTLPN